MKTCLRIAALCLAATSGLTAAPTQGADATLGPERESAALPGLERWSLRPTRLPPAEAPRASRVIALSDLPDERRTVRIVYEGYREAGPVSPGR